VASMHASTDSHNSSGLEALFDLASGRRRIVAFTGAGISTESGIPDYRGPGGVWEQRRPPTIGDFLNNPETRRAYWQRRLFDYPTLAAREPNAGHLALASLERAGLLTSVITQNIDGLHQKAGNDPERVIELHGTAHKIRCVLNGHTFTADEIHSRLEAGETDLVCSICGGILRSATVLFGEPIPPDAWTRALDASRACDLMLVVGSSLVVNPAARLPVIAKQHGAAVAIINRTATPLDGIADLHLLEESGTTLAALSSRMVAK
jgi:NAD-dependent protein deacetylase/lipoamidase